jgi:predicted ArsR family transcriptional regulator
MAALQVNEIHAIGVLHDPRRRALYTYVSRQRRDVSRDEAARALSISRGLAAFHLDRLAEAGLLEASYRRLTGRRGPGAGRPSKLYRRSTRQVTVNLPPRRYELLAQLFAGPLDEARGARAGTQLVEAAYKFGHALGTARPRPRRSGSFRTLTHVLRDLGTEPYEDGEVVRLSNCPFDSVASSHPELVCGTNLSLIDGVIKGLGVNRVTARLDPQPGRCCVALTRSSVEGGRHA